MKQSEQAKNQVVTNIWSSAGQDFTYIFIFPICKTGCYLFSILPLFNEQICMKLRPPLSSMNFSLSFNTTLLRPKCALPPLLWPEALRSLVAWSGGQLPTGNTRDAGEQTCLFEKVFRNYFIDHEQIKCN